ncbi:MAG: phosphoribosylglycinamide formyltransferase [Peptostreptococcaceae bacterium]|nr:phosphoribosylglycinamide formyltransferase [Peptostreptococcaceae bacterium]
MLKKKVAVLISGGGTNLQAIIDAEAKGIIKSAEVDLVISNKEHAFGLQRAEKSGIEHYYFNDENHMLDVIKKHNIDIIVLAGFLKILSKDFIKSFGGPIINIHPSLIPSFCGKGCYGIKVHQEALKYGVKVTGATVHYVNEIPDGGEIIAQKAVYIKDDDTPETLQKRVMEEAEWVLLPQAIEDISKKG